MEGRRLTIEGRPVIAIDTAPPIPDSLQLILGGGRDRAGRAWRPMRVTRREQLHLGGAAKSCATDDHRLREWLRGLHIGSDGVARDLALKACADCGAVCVRDVSIDSLPSLRPGRLALRRRDHVLGWYTGARPRQRTYA